MSEKLQMDGIFAQGYGLIAKAPMLDPDLSITAKAIYAYLCSLAGNGSTAFPSRDRIVSALGINKDTYYKHLDNLLMNGYLRVEKNFQQGHQFANNIYTIVTDIPVKGKELELTEHKLHSNIKTQGLLKKGYGMIARSVMSTSALSHKAKALYAYFCSFAGAGVTAWPGKSATLYYLAISHGTYNKLLRELTGQDYLRVEQRIERGRFGICDYILVDKPGTKISDTEKPDVGKPDTEGQDTGKPDAETSDPGEQDTAFSDTTNTSPSNNNLTSISFDSISLSGDRTDEENAEIAIFIQNQTHKDIENWISHEVLLDIAPDEKLEYLVDLVADACRFKDLKGLPPAVFIPKLLALSREEYEYVLHSVSQVEGIHNLKAYYLTCLLRAHEDYEAAIDQEVAADMAKGLI